MKLSLYMLPSSVPSGALKDSAVVVIDALRMTSVAVTAFENGCDSLMAVRTIEEALGLRDAHAEVVLGGEREGRLIPGFDLDNSPLRFTREAVYGKRLCMTTTNGTQAIAAAQTSRRVILGAFLNASAVARALSKEEDATILCAGTRDKLSLEDVIAGGAIIARLQALGVYVEMDDSAIAARRLYAMARDDLHAALACTRHYGVMHRGGQQADIDYCLREDVCRCVPQQCEDGFFRCLNA